MAYEISPIVEGTNPVATPSSVPHMREDREVDPYKAARIKAKTPQNPTDSGQKIIDSEIKAVSPEEPKAASEESVQLSPQVAALARKEQRFRSAEQDLKAKEKALEAERAEIADLKALKAKLQAKDFSGIENLVGYDDYTKYLIEKTESLTPEQQALKALAQKVDGVEKAHNEDISKRFEAAVNDRRKAVTALVETDPYYSSIKELNLQEAVVKHILDTWEEDGTDLSPEQASKEVEDVLVERAGRWSALSKLKPKEPVQEEKNELPPLKPGIKTLTNNMAATGDIKRPAKSFQHMSESERYAEARRRAEERLKTQGR